MTRKISELENTGEVLKAAFMNVMQNKYGGIEAPPPYITSFGIKHFDALLGGGLSSSLPVMFTSTPETGKSTLAFQFAKAFQTLHKNSIILYLDIENAAADDTDALITNRVDTFGINRDGFIYKPVICDQEVIFTMLHDLIESKREIESKINQEINCLFIWDSIASSGSSKDVLAEDANKIIGWKAREFGFQLSKIKPLLALNRISTLFIDQVRRSMKIKTGQQMYAREESSVGEFGDYKAATGVTALQHHVKQWLFFSKGKGLLRRDPLGVDGWELNAWTEKNKIAPSQYWITLIFDKKHGVIPSLSELTFLSKMSKTERKTYKDVESKMPCPFAIKSSGKSKILNVIDPTTNSLLYTNKFPLRKFKDLYEQDTTFKYWFDIAVEISIQYRIRWGYFNQDPIIYDFSQQSQTEVEPEIESQIQNQKLTNENISDVNNQTEIESQIQNQKLTNENPVNTEEMPNSLLNLPADQTEYSTNIGFNSTE